MKPSKIHSLASLQANTVEEGDCLLWQGYMYQGKIPQVYHQNTMVNVRKVFSQLLGKAAEGGYWSTTCGVGECVAPEHTVHRNASTHLRLMGRRENRSAGSEAIRRAKLIAAAQCRRKISDEQLLLLASSDRSSADLAREFGVSKALISVYRRGKRGHQAGPWQGLLR